IADAVLAVGEVALPHGSRAARLAAREIRAGRGAWRFALSWAATGVALALLSGHFELAAAAAVLAVAAVAVRNDLWVRVPQTLPIS
ncbi:MAG TPA: hypothetical protein VMV01_16930, partial [Planctomycetota bacterium]|nr:hypothetical protein [Planctomycetota bacterium]